MDGNIEWMVIAAAVVGAASVVVRVCAYASQQFTEYAAKTETKTDDLWAKRFAALVGRAGKLLSVLESIVSPAALQLPRKKNTRVGEKT